MRTLPVVNKVSLASSALCVCVLSVAYPGFHFWGYIVSDIAIFVLKRDVKLQLTNFWGYKFN